MPFVIDHIQASGGNPHNISYIRNGVDLTPMSDLLNMTVDHQSLLLHLCYWYYCHAHDVVTLVRAAKIVSDKMPGRFFLKYLVMALRSKSVFLCCTIKSK